MSEIRGFYVLLKNSNDVNQMQYPKDVIPRRVYLIVGQTRLYLWQMKFL